ncbi:MAG: Sir2 family NAD-dependent protein deacetylase [Thermomicrobiales bacterium]|nr:Sir2 family NAD-dependent protein deacetylase [Thermomicrobiales bacterium]
MTETSANPVQDGAIEQLVALARGKMRIAVFTGAGMSTESGIPDYRGPNGVWATQKPPTLGDFRTNPETRSAYWESRKVRFPELIAHQPNTGHRAIVRLFDAGLVPAVITQNIDGLHQVAGLPDDAVIELHGSARRVQCLDCLRIWDGQAIQARQEAGEETPDCQLCGGPLRAQTVLFGESLPVGALERAMAIARECDLMLVVGSSLIVQPAAKVPLAATRSGAPMAIVNLSETPLDHLATLLVAQHAGPVLETLSAEVLG